MLIVILLILVNAAVPHKVMLAARVEIAKVPINLLDALLFVSLIAVFATGRNRVITSRTHPLATWSIVLGVSMAVTGAVIAMSSGTQLSLWLVWLRNSITLPLAVLVGYLAAPSLRSARPFVVFTLLASLLSAVSTLLFVGQQADDIAGSASFDSLRAFAQSGDVGLLMAAMVAFAVVSRVRLMPIWVAAPVFAVCVAAYASLPHRSSWLTGALVMLGAALVLPRASVGRRVGWTLAGIVTSIVVLIAGVGLYSAATGRDFGRYLVEKRLARMIPALDDTGSAGLTDTRRAAATIELELFLSSPFFGRGFGITDVLYGEGGVSVIGFHHIVWTGAMAETGLIGLFAYVVPVFGLTLVGYRMWRSASDKWLALAGALGCLSGLYAFLLASMTMSINIQRPALALGLTVGLVARFRAIQLSQPHDPAGEYGDVAYEPLYGDRPDGYADAYDDDRGDGGDHRGAPGPGGWPARRGAGAPF
ncbi:MAG TPA: hypothetical protein VEA69_04705 [Tepidisphaeraceae bacterium]|nr:hypothetical protein [Tepidisphaeraceae bacterium]